MKKHLCVLLILLLSISVNISWGQSSWELAKNKNGIKVYTRNISGSNFKEFKGEMTVNTTMSALIALIDDIDNYTNWVHNCIKAERLETVSRTEGVNYTAVTAPWPVSDRDLIIRYQMAQNRRTHEVRIQMTGIEDYIPKKRGFVRVPALSGQWLFSPAAAGQITITYQVHSETGGHVPASIANAFVVDSPYYTLKSMREEIKKNVYRNASVEGLTEPH